MGKISGMVLAAFVFKNKTAGENGWAYVADFNCKEDFDNWLRIRKGLISHLAVSYCKDFITFQEIDTCKRVLKRMLGMNENCIDITTEEREHYLDFIDDMKHFDEKQFNNIKF